MASPGGARGRRAGAARRRRRRRLERRILTPARAALIAVVATACSYDRPPLAESDAATDGAAPTDAPPLPTDAPAGCVADDACASGICEAGACVAVDRVSYVATTGADAAPCTLAAPCATVNHALAVQANLGPLRRVVVEPGTYAQAIAVTGAAALIVGRAGTSPTPTLMAADRDVVTISGATLTMRHLTLTGSALGAGGDGVRCTNGAVNLAAVTVQAASDDGVDLRDCDATLDQVTITGSATFGVRALRGALVVRSSRLLGNLNGGLRTAPVDTLTVTGTVIARNGRAGASAVGGAELLANGAVLFDSNTVADNESGSDATRAIICNADGTYALPNNLLTNARAFTTTCPLTHSMSSMLFLPNGTNRPVRTPAYVAPTMGDYHLTAASEARGAGTAPTAMPAPDLDGEARPRGVLDVGADELD